MFELESIGIRMKFWFVLHVGRGREPTTSVGIGISLVELIDVLEVEAVIFVMKSERNR